MPHKGPEPGDRTVDGLLSPRVLFEMEAVAGFPPPPPGYDPEGDWSQSYRIWGNSGRFRWQSKNMGCLKLQRSRRDGRVEFLVDHVIVNADGIEHIRKASITCRDDELSSPVRWTLESHFTDSSRCIRPELSMALEGVAEGGQVVESCGGARRTLDVPPPFTADWCLFDAIPRAGGRRLEFTLLEGLTKPKPGHWVDRLGPGLTEKLAADGMRPFCVYEAGSGILPRQYWLDEAGRVVLTITNSIIYVLDDEAEQKKDELVVELIKGGVHYEY